MNYKLLFPTYRTRQRWVMSTLDHLSRQSPIGRMVNVGCGEGDIDQMLKARCDELVSSDINEGDVAHAKSLNSEVRGIEYVVADAQATPFETGQFDVACCLEVIEHVSDPRALLRELARIVKPRGHIVLTCPSEAFPVTYDPINWALARLARTERHVSAGAYGFGHSWLVREVELETWAREAGLEAIEQARLSKAFAGMVECYWPGLLQRAMKSNAGNRSSDTQRRAAIRPSLGEPKLVALTDWIADVDARVLAKSRRSVGLAYCFARP